MPPKSRRTRGKPLLGDYNKENNITTVPVQQQQVPTTGYPWFGSTWSILLHILALGAAISAIYYVLGTHQQHVSRLDAIDADLVDMLATYTDTTVPAYTAYLNRTSTSPPDVLCTIHNAVVFNSTIAFYVA